MKKLAAKDGSFRLRLIPPGKYRLPWFGSSETYPWIGHPAFWQEMTEEERDQLYAVYQERGLDALHDAVSFLEKTVWIKRYRAAKEASEDRGRRIMEGR